MGHSGSHPGSSAQRSSAPGNGLFSPLPQLTCSKNGYSTFNYLTKCCKFYGFKKCDSDYFPQITFEYS